MYRCNRYQIIFTLIMIPLIVMVLGGASYDKKILRSEVAVMTGPEAKRLNSFLDKSRIVSDKIAEALLQRDYTTAHSYFGKHYSQEINIDNLKAWFEQFESVLIDICRFEYRNQHFQAISSSTGGQKETGTQFYYVYDNSDLSPGWFLYISIIREKDLFVADGIDIVSFGLKPAEWLGPVIRQRKDR
jgi:hypothetical protein